MDRITAFLFHRGGHADPVRLPANAGKSFVGSYVLGMGFTFDDTDKKGVASPLTEMQRLIDSDPRIPRSHLPLHRRGGSQHKPDSRTHHRYVINFAERSAGGVPATLAGPDGDCRAAGEAGAVEYSVTTATLVGERQGGGSLGSIGTPALLRCDR